MKRLPTVVLFLGIIFFSKAQAGWKPVLLVHMSGQSCDTAKFRKNIVAYGFDSVVFEYTAKSIHFFKVVKDTVVEQGCFIKAICFNTQKHTMRYAALFWPEKYSKPDYGLSVKGMRGVQLWTRDYHDFLSQLTDYFSGPKVLQSFSF